MPDGEQYVDELIETIEEAIVVNDIDAVCTMAQQIIEIEQEILDNTQDGLVW